MNAHVSVGDIIFLTVALAALLLLNHFFAPPTWLALSFMGAGGVLPILSRVVRIFLPKSLWSLPLVLVLIFVLHNGHDLSGIHGVYFSELSSSFSFGL
jgi:hypothetical protein